MTLYNRSNLRRNNDWHNSYSLRGTSDFDRKFARNKRMFKIFAGIVAAFIVGVIVFMVSYSSTPGQSYSNCVVTDKSISVMDGESIYMVGTENCGMLTVTANPFKGIFNPSTINAGIKVGGTYNFETFGFSIPGTDVTESIAKAEFVR